jgi:VIT1/CCC1 family predicted Fe2+/Mn2+ transporter
VLNTHETRAQVVDPSQRIAEVLFGLIMVLTFTCSLGVAEAGRDDVRVMLIGAIGCNLAWAIIDGVFFLMGSLAEKGSALLTLKSFRAAHDPAQGRQILAGALPPLVASVMEPGDLDTIGNRLHALPQSESQAKLDRRDWLGALTVMALVFASTFPVAIPFLLIESARPALRMSNLVAIVMLFIAGHAYGRVVGRPAPWKTGVGMVILGAGLVAMAIPLGG